MHPITDSPLDRHDDGMTALDAASTVPAPAPVSAAAPMSGAGATAADLDDSGSDTGLVQAFDPERLLLGEHGGVVVIVGLLGLALVLLTIAFGALPR